MRLFAACLGGVLAVLAVSCAGGRSHATARLTTPCTNDATATAIVAINVRNLTAGPVGTRLRGIGTETPAPFVFLDDEVTCRIRKVLLDAGDLGGDWRRSRLSSPEFGADRVFQDQAGACGVPLTYLISGLRAIFEKGPHPTPPPTIPDTPRPLQGLLYDSVLVFKHGTAAEMMSASRRSCGLNATPSAGGPPRSGVQATPFSVPTIGDETIAFTTSQLGDTQFELLIRRGDVVERLILFGQDSSMSALGAIARLQDAKIAAQGDYLQPTPGPVVAATPTPDPASTYGILLSALPAPDELANGWIPGHSGVDFDGRILGFCRDAAPLPAGSYTASGSYDGNGLGRSGAVGIGLSLYNQEDAAAFMDAVRSGAAFPDGCGGSVRQIDVTWKVERLALAPLGDQSVAWRATARHTAASGSPDVPLISDIVLEFVVIRRRNVIALVVETRDAPPTGASDVFDQVAVKNLTTFAAKVDAKMAAVVKKLPQR